ncbi:hypothetical protein AAKU52_003293 [Pedobacter sp. CG_S7]|uniref:hypothetical protein n=1 Tax=Pedobacter sp. CG_S7 TaxID=3143930 RepID=UPI003393FB17
MGIRSEKRKVMQQIVTKDDTSLDLDPESLLAKGDLHWFDVLSKKKLPEKEEKTDTPDESDEGNSAV